MRRIRSDMLRIALVTAALAFALLAVKDGRVLARAGLVGTCSTVTAPADPQGSWEACRAGRLEGRPDLTRRSCKTHGVHAGLEYWRCPAPVSTGRVPS